MAFNSTTALRRMRAMIANNGVLKLLALCMAIMSYHAIRGATGFEVLYDLPLDIRVDTGVAILEYTPETIQVTFRGAQEDLRQIDQKRLSVVVRPRALATDGSEVVWLAARDVQGLGRGVRVVSLRPDHVTLAFDHVAEKQVAVTRPRIIGAPLAGRAEVEYEPKLVTIRGPRRRLTNLESLLTEPLDVDGRVASFRKSVKVLPPSDTRLIQIEPDTVNADVRIVSESRTEVWSNMPVRLLLRGGLVTSASSTPTDVTLTLSGRPEILDHLPRAEVRAFVDLTDEFATDASVLVRVFLPSAPDVTVQIEPASVHIRKTSADDPDQGAPTTP